MQKVIAFSIDVNQLVGRSAETFFMSEPEELNNILEQGWEIEDWSFLTDDPVNGKMPMLVVLNDDMTAGIGADSELWEEEEDGAYEEDDDMEEVLEADEKDDLDAE